MGKCGLMMGGLLGLWVSCVYANDEMAVDTALINKPALDKMVSEKTVLDKSVLDKSALENTALNSTALYSAVLDSTLNKATPKPATPNPIAANQVIANHLSSLSEPLPQTDNTLSLTKQELKNHPEIIIRALSAAVIYNKADDVAFFLPLYQDLPNDHKDKLMEQWAMAMLAENAGDYTKAIKAYRDILGSEPEAKLVRLRLAVALFYDRQWRAAEDQFNKLLSEIGDNDSLLDYINQHILAIKQQHLWTLDGDINWLSDKNINNAPKDSNVGGSWIAEKPQVANGVGVGLSAGKKWLLNNGYYVDTKLGVNGKYYWDNQKYNELNTNASLGFGHQNARHTAVMGLSYARSIYGTTNKNSDINGLNDVNFDNQSKHIGGFVDFSYRLNPNWQTGIYSEINQQHYPARQHLNGNNYAFNWNVAYSPNAQRSWFGGVNYSRADVRDASDSFVRAGIKLGVAQEWHNGFSTRTSIDFADKQYQGVHFFGKLQHNKEYGIQASLWNRRWHIAGITPRLTWRYQNVDSNLPLFRYDKQKVFIELSQRF